MLLERFDNMIYNLLMEKFVAGDKMKKNNNKATVILLIFFAGLVISYPFRHSFWGGLALSLCTASTIGGLADWFAVEAIFRKPLGIKWPESIFRTEIIPQNREKIFQGIIDIIENKLLTKENIRKQLENMDFASMLTEHFKKDGEITRLSDLASDVIADTNMENYEERFTSHAVKISEKVYSEINFGKVSAVIIERIKEKNSIDRVIDFLFDDVIKTFALRREVYAFITRFVAEVIKEYEDGSAGRKFTNFIVMSFIAKMKPEDVSEKIISALLKEIEEIHQENHPIRLKVENAIYYFQHKLENGDINLKGIESITDGSSEGAMFGRLIEELYSGLCSYITGKEVRVQIDKVLNAGLDYLKANDGIKNRINDFIRNEAGEQIDRYHHFISDIAKEKLSKYTNEEYVAMIEKTVGNDLQMIRINGSIVGGLVGAFIYILTFIIS